MKNPVLEDSGVPQTVVPQMVVPPSRAERERRGIALRREQPPESLVQDGLGGGGPDAAGRPDPVALLEAQAISRVPELVPLRHARMAATPFSFYRGAAAVMASDLSRAPASGLRVQLCGDAHLSNFGLFATPERRLSFDVNDFDETYPGPFEWDVKRLAASLAIAAQSRGFGAKQQRKIVRACAAEYRETMARQSQVGNLAAWYAHIEADKDLKALRKELDASITKRTQAAIKKAEHRTNLQAFSKLTTMVDGERRIIHDPPLLVPLQELFGGEKLAAAHGLLSGWMETYAATLLPSRRDLLGQFRLVQFARKVVGVGSVGTRTWIALMLGADDNDPLFLQVKEAVPSVLAAHGAKAGAGADFSSEGERVVRGQRLTQAASDIFLGWARGTGIDGVERDFYVRQLRDGKGSALVETMSPQLMRWYGRLCGRALAFGHARSGDRIAIAAYLGSDEAFEHAMADYADNYAAQNARDHAAMTAAIAAGRLEASAGA